MEKQMKAIEIARGAFLKELESAFQQAQGFSFTREVDVKVTCQITVHAPERDDPQYGGVSFKVGLSMPAKQSIKHSTFLQGGKIINDGASISDLLQEDLFEQEKVNG